MTSRQIRDEAVRVVNDAINAGKALTIVEYLSEVLYREDHPHGESLRDHNAVARATMREAIRRGVSFRRRLVAVRAYRQESPAGPVATLVEKTAHVRALVLACRHVYRQRVHRGRATQR